jgi:phosphotransferase system IIA component
VPIEIHVPELGESVADATVGRWLKQEGETVKSGEALVELETDKITFVQVAPITPNLILSYVAEHVLALPRSY